MRALEVTEIHLVTGGKNNGSTGNSSNTGTKDSVSQARAEALQACEGLSDNAQITYSYSISANVSGKIAGVGGEATVNRGYTVSTTCGELRRAAGSGS